MPNMTLLAVAGGLSIAGAVVGVGLGKSTVANINPVYLQDKDGSFYSDVVPGARSRADWAEVQAQEYRARDQAPPPPPGCAGCTWPVAPTPREDPVLARYDRVQYAQYEQVAPPERAEAPVRIVVVEQPQERDWSRVTRYSSYAVDRAEAAPPPQQDASGEEGDAATQ